MREREIERDSERNEVTISGIQTEKEISNN